MASMRDYPVPRGGILNSYKVKYSPETHALLKQLINESRLSMFQRKSVEYSLRNGDPLPLTTKKTSGGQWRSSQKMRKEPPRRVQTARKRSKDIILSSGTYERDSFVPLRNKPPYEEEKERLQSMMTYGKNVPQESVSLPRRSSALVPRKSDYEELDPKAVLEHFLKEIEDRTEFLNEMESLGKGKKYRNLIKQEIGEKLNMMEKIDKELSKILESKVNLST